MNKKIIALPLLLAIGAITNAQVLTQGFNQDGTTMISDLQGLGWAFSNQSDSPDPADTAGWFASSNFAVPPTPVEGTNSIASNFQVTAGLTGTETISTWMVTPTINLVNGEILSFWTASAGGFADRLQVRMSTNGTSTNTGTGSAGIGDFSNLLLDINPTLDANGYPTTFTQFNVTLSGVATATQGRLAFRYFVADGGANGPNSNAIFFDALNVAPVPEPATLSILGIGFFAALRRRNRR